MTALREWLAPRDLLRFAPAPPLGEHARREVPHDAPVRRRSDV
jgi:hypothetical protein